MDKEFEELYADELVSLRLTIKLSIKALEIFWEELQKTNLPDDIKMMLIKNYQIKGE